MRKPERRIYETFPEGRHLIKVFGPEDVESDGIPSSYSQKQLSPRRLKVINHFLIPFLLFFHLIRFLNEFRVWTGRHLLVVARTSVQSTLSIGFYANRFCREVTIPFSLPSRTSSSTGGSGSSWAGGGEAKWTCRPEVWPIVDVVVADGRTNNAVDPIFMYKLNPSDKSASNKKKSVQKNKHLKKLTHLKSFAWCILPFQLIFLRH